MKLSGVALRKSKNGDLLPLKVSPGAKTNGIRGVLNGRLKVGIAVVAADGKANAALLKWLTNAFEIPRNRVLVVSGETSRDKTIELVGVEIMTIEACVTSLIAASR